MKIISQRYELVDVSTLQLHPENPNKGDLEAIGRSINANGFYGAIIAQESTHYVLAGNHRFLSARAAGAKQVPVIWIDCDDKTARRILLVDNRASELSERDDEQLLKLLEQLRANDDLDGSGYSEGDVGKLIEKLARDDANEVEVEEVDVSEVHDEFWLSVRGPLPKQPEVLEQLRAALAAIPGVTVDLGTTEY